ncbi:MAG: M48 family metallopeptidase [Myxococcota bacterium]|nr:M48 family metallopeptidase [Myxococcota bacterium]
MEWNLWTGIFIAFFIIHRGFEWILDVLQNQYLKNRKDNVPTHLSGKVSLDTIRAAVAYNRDKVRFGLFVRLHSAVALLAMLGIGFRWIDGIALGWGFNPLVTGLLFFGMIAVLGEIWGLPIELFSIFGIESKHGFNKQTYRGFIADKVKGILISIPLGGILLSCVLLLMRNGGRFWWVYAYCCVFGIQLFIAWIYPVVIMPLFNRFTPVAADMAEDVARLAGKVSFPYAKVLQMDGSKRSTHSNAFFVGFRSGRRIILYDTLVDQLSRSQLMAVLAHELGHFKLNHLKKRLAMAAVGLLGLFAALSVIRDETAIYIGLGFDRVSDHAALVVFGLIASEVLSPFNWISRLLSRRDEYAADRFAVKAVGNADDLGDALIVLTKKNLTNPGSHKLYRWYYNSHPALRERLAAIRDDATPPPPTSNGPPGEGRGGG